jgi:uncharacterized protein YyaL (SSP411 family)
MNRLAGETSPYLLQHASNPVAWWPWGEEAFALARREDKPIFLSIGYAACHWCHVMAHESFEDPQTAETLNREFIAIKVDREERPDVDSIYMDAVVRMTGQGGWPLSAFLTPDGQPFYGGTYFPPERRHGLPAFREVLEGVIAAWRSDRERLEETAARLTEALALQTGQQGADGGLDPALETRAMEACLRTYDWDSGGWGGAPKFPQASLIAALLRRSRREKDPMALEMAEHALTAMSAGGLFDQVGGGFHRYTVDRNWTVPHFEKMLYDNALLGRVYVEAWQLTGKEPYRRTAIATLEFLEAELRIEEGGLCASLDADSGGAEGLFYTWSLDEIDSALGDQDLAAFVRELYDLQPGGNFDGRFVLRRSLSDSALVARLGISAGALWDRIDRVRSLLGAARDRRARPARDDKVIAAWNGLALSLAAIAARVGLRPGDLPLAQSLAAFLVEHLWVDGRLFRSWRQGDTRQPGFLEDYAAVATGLLDLYQTDFDPGWIRLSLQLADAVVEEFADPQAGFFDTSSKATPLIVRPQSLQDTPLPSGAAMAAALLLRLEALTGESRLGDPARAAVASMQATAATHPTAFAAWLDDLSLAAEPLPQLAIVGRPGADDFLALAAQVHQRFLPRLSVAAGHSRENDRLVLLSEKPGIEGRATAYLCRDFTCRTPTTSATELGRQLDEVR